MHSAHTESQYIMIEACKTLYSWEYQPLAQQYEHSGEGVV